MEDLKNAKSFKFNLKSDYIYYLSELIIDTIQKRERLDLYFKEIELLIKNNPKAKLVNSILYDTISDKTIRPLQYLFNLLGDESKKAVSYRKFRKILFRDQKKLGITIEELTEEERQILNEFNHLRNWGLHIPESIYIQKKIFFNMNDKWIIKNKNKIILPKYNNFEITFLKNYKEELETAFYGIDKILSRMKLDYEKLINEKFEIISEINSYKPYKIMEIAQNSWDVQKGIEK